MPLSVKEKINPNDIEDIQVLKEGKVLVLIGNTGEKIVLKQEERSTVTLVKGAKSVMKAVDSSIQLKILTKEEAEDLLAWVDASKSSEEVAEDLNGSAKNLKLDDLNALDKLVRAWLTKIEAASEDDPVLKMAFLEVQDLKSELDKRMATVNKDKTGIRAFVAALNADGGFEMLGRIIAADCVNWNSDRFGVSGGGPALKYGGRTFAFQALRNAGNLFLMFTGDVNKISGLDFIPPGKQADLTVKLDPKHPIQVLSDVQRRRRFASQVVADLEQLVSPKRSKLSLKRHKLHSSGAARIVTGMKEGVVAIIASLEKKYGKGKIAEWPEGLRERYEVLKNAEALK